MIACKFNSNSTTGTIQRLCFSKKQRKQHTLEFSKFHSISFHMRCDSTAPISVMPLAGGLGGLAHPEFGSSSVNPIPTKGGGADYAYRTTLLIAPPPEFENLTASLNLEVGGHVVTLILEFSRARWLHIFTFLFKIYTLYFLFFHTSLRNNFSTKLLPW